MRRSRSKTRDRAKKKRPPKPDLTLMEMLDRIPDRDWLTTKDVQRVFNDCHAVSVYRYVQQGLLNPNRVWGKKASKYARDEVEKLVRSKFSPRPVTETESETDDSDKDKTPGGRVRRKKSNTG